MDQRFATLPLKKVVPVNWYASKPSGGYLYLLRSKKTMHRILFLAGFSYFVAILYFAHFKAVFIKGGLPEWAILLVGALFIVFGIAFTLVAQSMLRVKTVFDANKRMVVFHKMMLPDEKPTVFAAFSGVDFSQQEYGNPPNKRVWEYRLVRKDGKKMKLDAHSEFSLALSDAAAIARFMEIPLVDMEGDPINAENVLFGKSGADHPPADDGEPDAQPDSPSDPDDVTPT